MSTPMRHGPSQQGRTPSQLVGAAPTPPVSTPFANSQGQTAFSPYHGSKTSPQQFKKSPATSATLKGLADGPAAVNFDSPSATAALGALGIHGNLELNLDALSMAQVGGGRADEDERRRRMDNLIATLQSGAKGRVSNEGLERLARSIGLEILWEDHTMGKALSKTLIMAGTGLALDIVITNHAVENVTLTLPESTPSVQQHVRRAADILLKDLRLEPGQSPLMKTLDKFQSNLERLAALDKLSVLPVLNCYNAVAGIYESLMKLHKWDLRKLREDPSIRNKSEEALQLEALCSRHGCPMMHARETIGLSLDYWKESRKIPSTTVQSEGMRTWSLLVDCAPRPDMMFAPIRISENWISDVIEKTDIPTDGLMAHAGPILDWQEPDNTLLPPGDENKNETGLELETAIPPNPKLPEVMFMATFEPPVIVSSAIAAQIYSVCGVSPPESNVTFDSIMFPITSGPLYDPSEPRSIAHTQPVSTAALLKAASGEESSALREHQNTLFIYKPVYGQVLQQVPIGHPQHLISMLPYLRQYAFLSTLLDKSFKPKPGFPGLAEQHPAELESTITAIDELQSFMSRPAAGQQAIRNKGHKGDSTVRHESFAVDITLTAHPVPRLQIVFPFRSQTANIMLEIQLDGKVQIVSDNIFDGDGDDDQQMGGGNADGMSAPAKGKGRKYTPAQWASMLELTEDIGVWIEYIKHKME